MLRGAVFASALLVAAGTAGCKPFANDQYSCDPSLAGECNEHADGLCVADHDNTFRCAYPDTSCPDGIAFGDQSGPSSGACASRPDLFDDGGLPVAGDAFVPPADAPPEDQLACVGNDHVLQVCILKTQQPRAFKDVTLYSKGGNGKTASCDFVLPINDAQTELCVIQGSTITFDGTVQLDDPTGDRPIAFVATDSITITGTLDGATRRNKQFAGPGVKTGDQLGLCDDDTAGADGGKSSPMGGGGGGGGGFGTAGGAGASGDNNLAAGGHAATGTGADTLTIASGCRGHGGGNGPSKQAGDGGSGGFPGGVVFLIAANDLTVEGTGSIDVSGEGGEGGELQAGGGGGGPGGLVGLDAQRIVIDGSIIGNGGGGGGGGGTKFAEFGQNGFSGSTDRANGGLGFGGAGTGGQGTDAQNTTGESGHSGGAKEGGGGGGGGQGVMWFVISAGTTVTGMGHAIGVAVQKQFL
jgi:hypothetical protein